MKGKVSLRKNKKLEFEGIYYDSASERLAAINLSKQFNIKFIEGKNVHIKLNGGEIDFFINGTFIEYHPCSFYDKKSEYYKRRRRILDNNGYKNYPLIVLDFNF